MPLNKETKPNLTWDSLFDIIYLHSLVVLFVFLFSQNFNNCITELGLLYFDLSECVLHWKQTCIPHQIGWLFGFYGVSTFVGYLMPTSVYMYIHSTKDF